MDKLLCKHCGRFRVSRPRGLCWRCFYAPAIRELYPSKVNVGIGAVNRTPATPTAATDAVPGTAEKIAIMVARAQQRQALFHPDDVRIASEDAPLWELAETPYARRTYRDHSGR